MRGFIRRLFGKDEPAPPAPTDLREWNEDWQAGDLAECTSDRWVVCPGYGGGMPAVGGIYRVMRVSEGVTWDGRSVIAALGFNAFPGQNWDCTEFRKLRPSLEACDDEFAVELRDRLGKPARVLTLNDQPLDHTGRDDADRFGVRSDGPGHGQLNSAGRR